MSEDPACPAHDGGGGRIRTFEGVSRQIYSLLPLAAWVPLPEKTSRVFSLRPPRVSTALARLLLCLRPAPERGFPEQSRGTHLYRSPGPGIGQPGPRLGAQPLVFAWAF